MELQLVKDGKIVFRVPLLEDREFMNNVRREIEEIENHIEEMKSFYSALASTTRIKMISELMRREGRGMKFRDFEYNPKIVWDGLKRMMNEKLIIRDGEYYRLSTIGFGGFIVAGIVLRRVLKELSELQT